MRSHGASTTIQATPERIWAILTDAPAYPDWEPNVLRIEGEIALGEKLRVFTTLSPDRAFPVEVTELLPGRRMVWSSGMPLGLFEGERRFELEALPEGETRVSTREEFRGLLLPVIGRSIPDLDESFEQFVAALKARAEEG